jgi:hypothetical protein
LLFHPHLMLFMILGENTKDWTCHCSHASD